MFFGFCFYFLGTKIKCKVDDYDRLDLGVELDPGFRLGQGTGNNSDWSYKS